MRPVSLSAFLITIWCLGNLGIQKFELLDPYNLNIDFLKDREKYLDFMASHCWSPDEMLKGEPQKYYYKYLNGEKKILKTLSEVS